MKTIDIVVPLYNEQNNVQPLYSALISEFAANSNYQFKIIFVDDGSSDNSFINLFKIAQSDLRVKVISFSRNFGKEMAVTAGVRESTADALIIMDADMQHPPSLIKELIKNWENGYDVVVAIRKYLTPPPIWKRFGSYLFNKIFLMISDTDSISGTTDFRLLDKKVVSQLKTFTERNRLVRGLIDWLGYKKTSIEFVAPPRFSGEASYSFFKLVRLAVNSLTSFSLFPLKMTGYLGIMFFMIFGFLSCFMLIDRFTVNKYAFTNLALIVVLNSFSLGIVMIGIGLIALYIGHIYLESVNRPLYIIKQTLNASESKNE